MFHFYGNKIPHQAFPSLLTSIPICIPRVLWVTVIYSDYFSHCSVAQVSKVSSSWSHWSPARLERSPLHWRQCYFGKPLKVRWTQLTVHTLSQPKAAINKVYWSEGFVSVLSDCTLHQLETIYRMFESSGAEHSKWDNKSKPKWFQQPQHRLPPLSSDWQVPPPTFTSQLRSDRRNCLCSRCWSPLDHCSLPSNLCCCPGERLDQPCCKLSLSEPADRHTWQMPWQLGDVAAEKPPRNPQTQPEPQNPQHRGKHHPGPHERPTRLNHSWHLWIISSHQKSNEFKLE